MSSSITFLPSPKLWLAIGRVNSEYGVFGLMGLTGSLLMIGLVAYTIPLSLYRRMLILSSRIPCPLRMDVRLTPWLQSSFTPWQRFQDQSWQASTTILPKLHDLFCTKEETC